MKSVTRAASSSSCMGRRNLRGRGSSLRPHTSTGALSKKPYGHAQCHGGIGPKPSPDSCPSEERKEACWSGPKMTRL